METMKEYLFLSECWGGFISHFIDADLWHSFSDCHPNVKGTGEIQDYTVNYKLTCHFNLIIMKNKLPQNSHTWSFIGPLSCGSFLRPNTPKSKYISNVCLCVWESEMEIGY